MAGGITPEFLEELKYKCDIVEIISQYVPLQKKGGRYFGCCPFHNEKTGSFCVNQSQGYYHCFGCGASGDVIKFIMEIESIDYIDAIKFLADKVGMVLPEFKFDNHYKEKKEHKDVLKQLMKDVARYYRNNLLDENKGKDAREYLKNRGIDDETMKRYGLGLSLDYESMVGYMRRKQYGLKDLLECGLISNVDRPSDAFANRIIVPIMNGMGDVIAFGGRIYHGEQDIAKYKNSTNTTLFDKGRTIYGINFIKNDKKRKSIVYQDIILVEGYMDVISLGSAGIKNAVAGMGTALTEGQAREIAHLTQNVYVCYDGDGAGRKASVKNVEPLLNCGLDVKVISLDDGKDPDETVRADGFEGFMRKKDEALPVIEYKLKLCQDAYDLGSVNGRAKYVQAALKVLESVSNKAEREVYLNIVSKLSLVSVQTLKEQVGNLPTKQEPAKKEIQKDKDDKNLLSARFVLHKILDNANYVQYALIDKRWFENELHQKILDWAKTQPIGEVSVSKLYDVVGYENEINSILSVDIPFANLAQESAYFQDCLLSMANEYIKTALDAEKEHYNTLSNIDQKREAMLKITSLQKALKSKSIQDKL